MGVGVEVVEGGGEVFVVVVASVVVVVGLNKHSPDLKSHSWSGQESHLFLQSLP